MDEESEPTDPRIDAVAAALTWWRYGIDRTCFADAPKHVQRELRAWARDAVAAADAVLKPETGE